MKINTDGLALREEQAATLAQAQHVERHARKARREDPDGAARVFDNAAEMYGASGLDYHGNGESELAKQVRNAIARCRKCASNLRHPKTHRPAATTPAPDCRACRKKLRRASSHYDGRTTHDGKPREWGSYGDNLFCGLSCGYRWAIAIASQRQ